MAQPRRRREELDESLLFRRGYEVDPSPIYFMGQQWRIIRNGGNPDDTNQDNGFSF